MTEIRRARVERSTKESDIVVELDLDGTGNVDVDTGIPFYDHMLTSLGSHASFDLTVRAKGDVHIEGHHTIEDTAIVLGQALGQALGDKVGIRRFGDAFVPMDETLAHAAVDVSGRPYCVHTGEPDHLRHTTIVGSTVPYHTVINRHVFESLAMNARIALHVRTLYGRDPHHITEAQYKGILANSSKAKGWGWRIMRRNPGVYVKGRVRHADHATITLHGWHRVLMNTEGQSKAMKNVAFLD